MLSLYRYGSNSFLQKCSNFYRQGKFMEDYEDDVRWAGAFRHYFPVYHDLNIKQLRGYFSWRTHVRKGEFLPIAISMAYIYLYELLNGIGADSPEDALEKMKAFETNFLNAGLGDSNMQKNLRRWMLEYAVIHNIPADEARQYANPEVIAKDDALAVLKNPEESSDEEIFCALCTFAGKKLEQSSAIKKGGPRGKTFICSGVGNMRRGLIQSMEKIFSRHVLAYRSLLYGVLCPMRSTGKNTGMQIQIMYWTRAEHIDAAAACGGKNGITIRTLTKKIRRPDA